MILIMLKLTLSLLMTEIELKAVSNSCMDKKHPYEATNKFPLRGNRNSTTSHFYSFSFCKPDMKGF